MLDKGRSGAAEPLVDHSRSALPEHPVLGVDPSTRRVAVACVFPDARFEVRTISFGTDQGSRRLAVARAALVPWLAQLGVRWQPGWLFVEEPFAAGEGRKRGGRGAGVPNESLFMLGVFMEAAYTALGLPSNLLQPSVWKSNGLGPGHGFAKKRQILDWARAKGYAGQCEWCKRDGSCQGSLAHDEADAIGVATAGARLVSARVSAVRGAVDDAA